MTNKTSKQRSLDSISRFMPLREYCRIAVWPKLSQFNHWIYSKHELALTCIKKVGGRYLIDVIKFHEYIESCDLEGKPEEEMESLETE